MKNKVVLAVLIAALIGSIGTITLLGLALSDANKEIKKLKVNEAEYKEQLSMCNLELSVSKNDVEEAWVYYNDLFNSYIELGISCGAYE